MIDVQPKLFKYKELDHSAKKKAAEVWLKYYNQYYMNTFVSGCVRAFMADKVDLRSFNMRILFDSHSEIQIVNQNSVMVESDFIDLGKRFRIKESDSKDKREYIIHTDDNLSDDDPIYTEVNNIHKRVVDYAAMTLWWYYKFISNGNIFERYGFEHLEDGTLVKLLYE